MAVFSARSNIKLLECHEELRRIARRVIRIQDISVLTGYRDEKTQNDLYDRGLSKVRFPDGKHNCRPSKAIDLAPYPIDWGDTKRFYFLGGLVLGIASQLDIGVRWGGDWDGDSDFDDQTFNDLVHFELRE